MSQKLTTEDQQNELSWEDAVARYLEDHPDYFETRPDTLARMVLAHEVDGRAVSLIERQVSVLREREDSLNRQLRELVGIARENDVLGNRLHRFAMAMLDAPSLDDALDIAAELLRQEFRLDAVAVRIRGAAGDRAEIAGDGDRQLAALLTHLTSGKPLCGGRHDEASLRYLYGDHGGEILSTALVPLGDKADRGVLALGSRDPQRFHPGMGTVYLSRLGELLMHGLVRHLR
jgi:uncharacterized protein